MNPKILIATLILYAGSTVTSFAMFNYFSGAQKQAPVVVEFNEDGGLAIDPGEPRTEVCPLNGQKFTKTERAVWETRRPLAVMIENSVDARPQSGIGSADIVYEAVAEGGVTRFMALMYCDAVSQDTLMAPVRSARTYFVDWASGYNQPMYAHVGGGNCSADKLPNGGYGPCKSDKRAQAIEQISDYGWRLESDIDGMSVGLPVYYRDYQRLGGNRQLATEHTMTTSTERLWTEASERDWTNTNPDGDEWLDDFIAWEFKDEAPEGERGSSQQISYDFWDGYKQYDVQWNYDPATNSYQRSMGGEAHIDLNTGDVISVKDVVVLLTEEIGPVDELKHMLYTTIGQGDALLFRDGKAEEIRWTKKNRTAPIIFADKSGDEIEFTRGKIWISVIDENSEVGY